MKKELVIASLSAIVGSAGTVGFDTLKQKYLKQDDPLAQGVTELSHISKELILEQKALNSQIELLAEKASQSPELKVEIGDIINRVNNIVQTSVVFETKSRDVSSLAIAAKSKNVTSSYNANADAVIAYGQAVTVCGNENTLGVEKESGRDAVIYLNGDRKYASVGEEYRFISPVGPSMVSYLGKNSEMYEFRIVCGTTIEKA